MKFKEYNGLDLSKLAVEILENWESNKAFEKSIALRVPLVSNVQATKGMLFCRNRLLL